MYDGSTACAEAVLMARRITRRNKAVLSGGLHPHYLDVTDTHSRFLDLDLTAAPPDPEDKEDLAGMIDLKGVADDWKLLIDTTAETAIQ